MDATLKTVLDWAATIWTSIRPKAATRRWRACVIRWHPSRSPTVVCSPGELTSCWWQGVAHRPRRRPSGPSVSFLAAWCRARRRGRPQLFPSAKQCAPGTCPPRSCRPLCGLRRPSCRRKRPTRDWFSERIGAPERTLLLLAEEPLEAATDALEPPGHGVVLDLPRGGTGAPERVPEGLAQSRVGPT